MGRPADLPFSEASAGFAASPEGSELLCPFSLETVASPVAPGVARGRQPSILDVEELQPITITVTVRCRGRLILPPARIDLREVPAFKRAFYIEDVTDGKRPIADASTWRWVYRLRPKTPDIAAVPGVPFVFYNPDLKPPEKAFQVLWSDPHELRVRRSEPNGPPIEAPDIVLTFVGGPETIRRQTPWQGPGAWLFVVLVGTPIGCVGWYLVWKRLYPDAARLARQRRSRAARVALRRLDTAALSQGRTQAEQVAAALRDYLGDRLGFAHAEPTPQEVTVWMESQELRPELIAQACALLDDCAVARFGPEASAPDLAGPAARWILLLEEALCPPPS